MPTNLSTQFRYAETNKPGPWTRNNEQLQLRKEVAQAQAGQEKPFVTHGVKTTDCIISATRQETGKTPTKKDYPIGQSSRMNLKSL